MKDSFVHVCAVMVVRDEEELIRQNLRYHAFQGFTSFVVVDHRSTDRTSQYLADLQHELALEVVRIDRSEFDHEGFANEGLSVAIRRFNPDWIFPLDADEFFCTPIGLEALLATFAERRINYASAKWRVAVPQGRLNENGLTTDLFYDPWPERPWQAEGHFRKAFCRSHAGMSIVAGGHYFRREVNSRFFSGRNIAPYPCSYDEAYILHFEARLSPERLLRKWQHLSTDLVEPNYPTDAPWNEKLERMREYAANPSSSPAEALHAGNFPVTFWGSRIPAKRLHHHSDVRDWLLNSATQSTAEEAAGQ